MRPVEPGSNVVSEKKSIKEFRLLEGGGDGYVKYPEAKPDVFPSKVPASQAEGLPRRMPEYVIKNMEIQAEDL